MAISLRRIIIHEVKKEPRITGSTYFLSLGLLPIDDNTKFLAEELNKSFGKDNIFYGQFSDEEPIHTFRDEFRITSAANFNDQSFVDFSHKSTANLSNRIGSVAPSKGGYLVYCEYDSREVSFVSVYLVRDTERVLFQRDGDIGFNVEKMDNVDTDKLAMACRIHRSKYDAVEHGYLQFIKNRQAVISDYFLDWIAASQATSSRDLTDKLVHVIQDIGLGVTEDGQPFEDIDLFHKAVTDFIRSSPGANVNLKDIGLRFYQDEDKIVNHIVENDIDLDTEFRAHLDVLRKLHRVYFKQKNIELKFTHGDWQTQKVRILNNRVVIESDELVAQIRAEFETE